jgi:hypothetical protein
VENEKVFMNRCQIPQADRSVDENDPPADFQTIEIPPVVRSRANGRGKSQEGIHRICRIILKVSPRLQLIAVFSNQSRECEA